MDAQRRLPINGASNVKPNGNQDSSSMSRAEKFEDEKQRIIDSLFAKREQDGAYAESYITHIRITEDASSPSAPPPPSSAIDNKKPRVVIVSVKRSGRVRLHKARENNNGTFSIGKTWVLDDLSAIESFTAAIPTTYEEQQRKEWAGDTGVLMTIQKPYFWQTATAKEKDFFIGSLVKIYRKYTKGREPQLTGFSTRELAEFSSTPGLRSRPGQPPSNSTSPAPTYPTPSLGSPPPPHSASSTIRSPQPSQETNGKANRDPRPPSAGSTSTRDTAIEDRPSVPSLTATNSSQSLRPQDPIPRVQKLRSSSNSSSKQDALRPVTPRSDPFARPQGPNASLESLPNTRFDNRTPPIVSVDKPRTNGTYSPFPRKEAVASPPAQPLPPGPKSPDRKPSNSKQNQPRPASPKGESLPERKRPPMLSSGAPKEAPGKPIPGTFAASKESLSLEPQSMESSGPTNGVPSAEQSKRSAAEFFMAASKRMKDIEPKRPFASDSISETPTEIKDISGALSTLSSPSEGPGSPEEAHRPGLGPMIRKKKSSKEVATAFRKAAVAHNAFKPRIGGAADRLRDELTKTPNTPDGIHGVFVAPSKEALKSPHPPPSARGQEIASPEPVNTTPEPAEAFATPSVEIERASDVPNVPPLSIPKEEAKLEPSAPPKAEPPKKRPSDYSAKYAKALGIDPLLLEGRTLDIDSVLTDFGWTDGEKMKKSFEDLQSDIRRDLAKVETGSWLGSFEYGDGRVLAVDQLLDKAIAECDELDGLLTLYNVELGTLADDVAFVEAQSQGLQVQTANQRLLQTELNTLLQTISISSSQLSILRDAKLGQWDGIREIGAALVQLYRAMLTIDPSLGEQSRQGNVDQSLNSIGTEVSSMRAVQEKRDGYRKESNVFVMRFKEFMTTKFERFEGEIDSSLGKKRARSSPTSKIDLGRREAYRADFSRYSAFTLFAREISPSEFVNLLGDYVRSVKRPYEIEFRQIESEWKDSTKRPMGEEQDFLFTTQEKESEGLGRKLTVKRSKTLREGPRNFSSGDKSQDGKIPGYQAFAHALEDMSQAVFLEQNFMVDLFHLSSLETVEFPDAVENMINGTDKGQNLSSKRTFDPDRNKAKDVKSFMEKVFSFWLNDLSRLVKLLFEQDKLQAVGLLFAIECRKADLDDSDQEFITMTLKQVHATLEKDFNNFIESQISAIRSQMVKTNKRKGVIAFMKTFPLFSANIESMLLPPQAENCNVRDLVNDIYVKINKAMFDTLKFIAKESGVALGSQKSQVQAGGETEDKEILNYHILMIENMNHYLEGVEARGNPVLSEWRATASKEMAEHMDLYLSAVVRRPLGKMLDFLESTESLIAAASNGPASIASRASHSRSTVKKLLSNYDAKEVNKGIDTLKKRITKHFGEADEPGLSQDLITKVFRECSQRYVGVYDRLTRIIADVYEGGGLDIEFKREEIPRAFGVD